MTKLFIIKLITYYSIMQGVDYNLALSVAKVESNYNQSAIGKAKEIGLFQINPRYYKNPKELKDVHNNINVGLKMIKDAKNNCKHKNNLDFMICYNAGIAGGNKIKNPKTKYVLKINKEYKRLK